MLRANLCDTSVWLAVISTGRPHAVADYRDRVGVATWYVSPGEERQYRDAGAVNVFGVEGLSAARNAALTDAFRLGAPCVQISDDIRGFIRAVPTAECTDELHRYRREESTLADVVQDLADTHAAYDARLVGVSATDSLIFYNHLRPTSFRNFILGDCMFIAPTPLRFDERLSLKEDYDYTAQHLERYGIVVRQNQWILKAQHRTNAGGAVARRTLALEQASIALLQTKWGESIMRANRRKPGEVTFRWPAKPAAHGWSYTVTSSAENRRQSL